MIPTIEQIDNGVYQVTEKDLIGDIKDFPIEVVQRMVNYQVKQGNKPDVKVFQNRRETNSGHGGFRWDKTEEGLGFWDAVICENNFNLFFQKYPKQNQLTIKKDMETNKLILNGITLPTDTEVKVSVEDGATIITFEKQEEKVEEPKFKSGDIIYVEEIDGGYVAIFQQMLDDVINIHAVLHNKTGLVYTNLNGAEILIKKNILSIRLATEEEQKQLFESLAKQKKLCWNIVDKKFEEYRWRAEKGGEYWYISAIGEVCSIKDNYFPCDDTIFNLRNYFQTEELANKAQPLWKDFFKNLSL